MTTLILPYPPSANAMWRSVTIRGHARVLLSSDGRAFKAAVARICTAAGLTPMEGPLAVVLRFYRPRKAGDLSNRIKATEDALNGFAWVDDSQIVRLVAERHDDKANPRVEVQVMPAVAPHAAVSQAFREHEAEVERIVRAKDETPAERIRRLAVPNVKRGGR